MNLSEMVIPAPAKTLDHFGVACCLAKLNWIESDRDYSVAANVVNTALERVGCPRLPYNAYKMNIGTRQRISLMTAGDLAPESYRLTLGNETIVVEGGDAAGIFYGAQTLAQIIAVSSCLGGHERFVPVGVVEDAPRFQYRGLMLDSARHFQRRETILRLLDEMARYKLNRFHWHLVDRQGWRLPLECHPELANIRMPQSRCYSHGAFSFDDIAAIREYAAERHIVIVPEIEMPGHSAEIFLTHPELACSSDAFGNDHWELCIGKPETTRFMAEILAETAALFPDSPILHIGGDEAATGHWERCAVCKARIAELGLKNFRELERAFMSEMAAIVEKLGRRAMVWGTPANSETGLSDGPIIQNWLQADVTQYAGRSVVNSFHQANYFDYPASDADLDEGWRRKQYEFDAAAGLSEEGCRCILGGEGCLWTEQIPEWRVMPRVMSRLDALAESLWSRPERKSFDSFNIRARLLAGSGMWQ